MRRRDFIKSLAPLTTAAALTVNGLPVRAMAGSLMLKPFSCDQVNDRVLVLIQLHGGNDGLNTIIPLDQYDVYRSLRPTIGILDNGPRKYLELSGPLANKAALHPDLIGIKEMYDQGYVNIIQDVAYTNINGSHFRGTDIWLSGVDGTVEEVSADSGWMGRFLDHKYPNYPGAFPNPDMPDPPGLEFGSHIVSLGFHRMEGIPMGLTMSNNPDRFFEEVAGVGGLLPEDIPASEYGNEIRFIAEVEKSTDKYAQRLAEVYAQGTNAQGVEYPEVYHTPTTRNFRNGLSGQLRTVARLISGGCSTKIYLVRMGGFDTHANQAIAGKPSFGGHGALLYHLSSAVKAFYDDLKAQNLDHRVVSVTFSEFGRQVGENGDWGTDHGTTAPMLVFGRAINPGVMGENPRLSNINNNRFVGYQHDYRQVFATILQDWLGANNGTLQHVEFLEFANQKLDLINSNFVDQDGNAWNFVADTTCDPTEDIEVPELEEDPNTTTPIFKDLNQEVDLSIYPNPATDQITLTISSDMLVPAMVKLYDLKGRLIQKQNLRLFDGEQQVNMDVSNLSSGVYPVQIDSPRGILALDRVVVR